MGLLDRISQRTRGPVDEARYSLTDYFTEPFNYGGLWYQGTLNTTYPGLKVQQIGTSLPAYTGALASCPPAFAAQMVRSQVLSQARFVFRNTRRSRTPGRLWSSSALTSLEQPWTNATTGELLSRMEWHAALAGNAYVLSRDASLHVLRPDWVSIMFGSKLDPSDPLWQIDATVVGYVYRPSGPGSDRVEVLSPSDVAHWSPIPDPLSPGLGMSWLTPAIRDIQGDKAATEHKLAYFTNGATPNLVVKGLPATNQKQFNELVDLMESQHRGLANAYKTLYLTAGSDASVVGANMAQSEFHAVQASGETRISMLSRVPASLLGTSEGLAGSSLNAGNFSSARRTFADTWVYPTLQDICSSLAPLVTVPADSELWFDTADIPLLREDGKDAAEIAQVQAATIRTYIDAGYEPDSVVKAVKANDTTLLTHSGLYSVQLQPPGTQTPAVTVPPKE